VSTPSDSRPEPAPWRVEVAPSALRSLDRLPPRVAAAVVEFVTGTLPANPERMSKPLRYELEGLRSARRGDYRVLFALDDAMRTLLVVRIAHRADAYR
jgi:mRNA-degrading endonuclease RelE of RelBE toxin-antitoxin system